MRPSWNSKTDITNVTTQPAEKSFGIPVTLPFALASLEPNQKTAQKFRFWA